MVALFDTTDAAHAHYHQLVRERWQLVTTWPCIVEVTHFLEGRATQAFLRWISEGGVVVYPFDSSDLPDMAKMMQVYTQWPRTHMDFADASLVWLAHDSKTTRIMTIDVRDFSRYRLPGGRCFEIL
jgi:hypothetical protein